MEATPDTVISLTTGQKFVVIEPPETVIERIVAFRRRVVLPAAASPGRRPGTGRASGWPNRGGRGGWTSRVWQAW